MVFRSRLSALCVAATLAVVSAQPSQARPREPAATASNAFGLDLYKVLGRRNGNLFFSPFDVSTALSMVATGARGRTAVEMRRVLGHTQPKDEVDAGLGDLSRDMAKREDVQLKFATALWADRRFALNETYRRAVAEAYDGEVGQADFAEDGEGARLAINHWVEARTAHRIKDLLTDLPKGPLVVTSAVYLKADWVKPFDHQETTAGDFHPTKTATVSTPLMHAETGLRYLDGGAFQAVAIPYRGDLSMVVFLPKRQDGLRGFERTLSAGKLDRWLSALEVQPVRQVRLTLPRYRLDERFLMKEALRPLGLREAFTDTADFSGIDSVGDLKIDDVIHRSFLAVDEQGTEAAAATAVLMVVTSARVNAKRPIEFRADHPFYFLIRDDRSGTILFMGRLETPAP